MTATRQRTWRRYRLIGIVLLLALPTAVASADETRLEGERSEIDQQQRRAERDLDAVRDAEDGARHELAEATEELDAAEAELASLESALLSAQEAFAVATANEAEANARLAEVSEELARTEVDLDDKRERLSARVRAAFKYGNVSFVEAFVGTKDITEFLNSGTYVASVLDGDRALVAEVTGLLAEVEDHEATAAALRVEAEQEAIAAGEAADVVEAALVQQSALVTRVEERREAHERALERLAEDRAAMESHLAGLAAESQRIEHQLAEIARQQAEEEARRLAEEEARRAEEEARRRAAEDPDAPSSDGEDSGDGSGDGAGNDEVAAPPTDDGGWIRPIGGPVTSPFGPRWGRNHNGVDLGAGVGTPVAAARPGVVVHVTNSCHPTSSFGCGGGFGNYVTVAHTGGMATVYAHLSSVAVGNGQTVSAGATIGGVGNSGNSYGPHLHFEVRERGAPRNPCGYISC